MSKKQSKSQAKASSSRASAGGFSGRFGQSSSSTAFGASASPLSYITEPPDLSGISDPNLVVAFKNLSKKDATTKGRGLEEIENFIRSDSSEGIEDGLLETWAKLFPRISIDNSRSVRTKAQVVNGQLSVACGKRILKFLPKTAGAWLAGECDSDTSVSRAAKASSTQVFSSNERQYAFLKSFQQSILVYFRNALEQETPQSLSDERTVSPDDADAKYFRVVATSIAGICRLVAILNSADQLKYLSDYDDVLRSEMLWHFSSAKDILARKETCKLLRACIEKKSRLDMNVISHEFIYRALHADQTGSAVDLLQTLVVLTKHSPEVWTKQYAAKKPAMQRLQHFVAQGSQSSPAAYWGVLSKLFEHLPKDILPAETEKASEILKAIESGVAKREERARLASAYNSFMEIASILLESLAAPGQRQLVADFVWPHIARYVLPGSIGSALSEQGVQKALKMGVMPDTTRFKWAALTESLVENLRRPSAHLGRAHATSQSEIAENIARWATILSAMLVDSNYSTLKDLLVGSLNKMVKDLSSLIKGQDGNSYDALGSLQKILLHRPLQIAIIEDQEITVILENIGEVECPRHVLTASCERAVALVFTLDQFLETSSWEKTLLATLNAPPSRYRSIAAQLLISDKHAKPVTESAEVQQYIRHQADLALSGRAEWKSISTFLSSKKTASDETSDSILSKMVNALIIGDESLNAVSGVRTMVEQQPERLKEFASHSEGSKLLSSLLVLSESPNDELAHAATAVSSSLRSLLSGKPMQEVVQQGLHDASSKAPSVETLVQFSKSALSAEALSSPKQEQLLPQLLPNRDSWKASLEPFLQHGPPPEAAITDLLGGGVLMAHVNVIASRRATDERDVDGYSAPLRMALYTIRLIRELPGSVAQFAKMPFDYIIEYMRLLQLTSQLANDNLGLHGANDIWSNYSQEVEEDMIDFVASTPKFLSDLIKFDIENKSTAGRDRIGESLANTLLQNTVEVSPVAFYHARSYAVVSQDLLELQDWNNERQEQSEGRLRQLRREKNALATLAVLGGSGAQFLQSKYGIRVCNELVADMTALKIASHPEEALMQFIQLNSVLQMQPDTAATVAKQRMVFFIKHLVGSVKEDTESLTTALLSEIYKALAVAIPLIKDIYGEIWNDILEGVASFWIQVAQDKLRSENLPALHSSLKLYGALTRLKADEDTNDDLIDVLKESEETFFKGLLVLLQQHQRVPDESRQPLRIVNELLSRTISKLPIHYLKDPADTFPLLSSDSRSIQKIAFDMLHDCIPASQEKISFEAALEKQVAQLPEELLSLILQAPDTDTKSIAALKGRHAQVPLTINSYLLSWQLVFDHFQGSSYKVQTDYVAHVKSGDYLPQFLDFASTMLGHSVGKPVEVSGFVVRTYEDTSPLPALLDIQAQLTRLYFLALKHLPSLAKSWWINCNRQTSLAIEWWTEKYISPHIIADALQGVSDWSRNQDGDADEMLTVRVSPRVREVTASYEVDEQQMTMQIRLPATYPLQNATVEGINRVAISEKKWKMWLINTQGVITFSNNNLVDGLVAWRRNIVAALKGHTECAICYSLVSADKQLPSKRCQTCKNLFHGSCLFKWFKTSNGSTCPLCRTQFNYG